MRRNRTVLVSILTLALAAGTLAGEAPAAKKKKSKAGGTADISKVVAAAIPDATATTNGVLTSTIDVGGKKFQGTRVRDVNVTLQTTGNSADSVEQLTARLTAPDGTTSWLFPAGLAVGMAGPNLGPLTFDDETPISLLFLFPPPVRNSFVLGPPFVGTAQPLCAFARGACNLSAMDNGLASGTWTLRVYDIGAPPPTVTSILNSWRLVVQAGKPFQTK